MTQSEMIFDLAVIGGGINGVGIAADASGRGLSVMLCEKGDLASGTSSASSKLIHGGLRYLEHYEFRLVREALAEREVLLRSAPHLVQPMKFTLPHRPHLRPAWMIRAGLFLYDHLTRRNTLPGTRSVRFDTTGPLQPTITKGFEYYDCRVDDARLVVTNAIAARANGATIQTRTKCIKARRIPEMGYWEITLQDTISGKTFIQRAKALVNAAGPWLNQFIENSVAETRPSRNIRWIKGSHVIVPAIHDQKTAYILQNSDHRVVFVIPYLDKFSLIGTTDQEYKGDLDQVEISENEKHYLLGIVNHHFVRQLTTHDIVASYSGVRPLCDDESADPSAITRDYTVDIADLNSKLPLLSVYGGKLTTYRKLAEYALHKLEPYFPKMGPKWTQDAILPGAEYPGQTAAQIRQVISFTCPWLPEAVLDRYTKSYGVRCLKFLKTSKSLTELGVDFGAGLYQAEVENLLKHEWACSTEDILFRRTKLYLFLSELQVRKLEQFIISFASSPDNRDDLSKADIQACDQVTS